MAELTVAPGRGAPRGYVSSHATSVEGPFMRGPVTALVRRYAGRLRYPKLLVLTAALFAIDLFVPDIIPFADEILLGLAAVILSNLRTRPKRPEAGGAPDDPPRR